MTGRLLPTGAELGANAAHLVDPNFPNLRHSRTVQFAHHLPSKNIFRHCVTAGVPMSYGVDTGPMWRRGASYVAKILRAAKPAELPVEQASNFELVGNLQTDKALGITLPTSILLRAEVNRVTPGRLSHMGLGRVKTL